MLYVFQNIGVLRVFLFLTWTPVVQIRPSISKWDHSKTKRPCRAKENCELRNETTKIFSSYATVRKEKGVQKKLTFMSLATQFQSFMT